MRSTTSQDRPYARLHRAIAGGNPLLVRAAAAELPAVGLEDALAICLVLLESDPGAYEPAAVRSTGGVLLERPGLTSPPPRRPSRTSPRLREPVRSHAGSGRRPLTVGASAEAKLERAPPRSFNAAKPERPVERRPAAATGAHGLGEPIARYARCSAARRASNLAVAGLRSAPAAKRLAGELWRGAASSWGCEVSHRS